MTACGVLFMNEDGDVKTCVLSPHSDSMHCDGVDRPCEDYECDNPVADICYERGLVDRHGIPTNEYWMIAS